MWLEGVFLSTPTRACNEFMLTEVFLLSMLTPTKNSIHFKLVFSQKMTCMFDENLSITVIVRRKKIWVQKAIRICVCVEKRKCLRFQSTLVDGVLNDEVSSGW